MGETCFVECCRQRRNTGGKIMFFHFPKNPALFKAWLKAIGREGVLPKRRSKVCSRHFDPQCFHTTPQGSRLNKGAVPTLFLHLGTPMKVVEAEELPNKRRYVLQRVDATRGIEVKTLRIPTQAVDASSLLSPFSVKNTENDRNNENESNTENDRNDENESNNENERNTENDRSSFPPSEFISLKSNPTNVESVDGTKIYRLYKYPVDGERIGSSEGNAVSLNFEVQKPHEDEALFAQKTEKRNTLHKVFNLADINKSFWETAMMEISRQNKVIELLKRENHWLTQRNEAVEAQLKECKKRCYTTEESTNKESQSDSSSL